MPAGEASAMTMEPQEISLEALFFAVQQECWVGASILSASLSMPKGAAGYGSRYGRGSTGSATISNTVRTPSNGSYFLLTECFNCAIMLSGGMWRHNEICSSSSVAVCGQPVTVLMRVRACVSTQREPYRLTTTSTLRGCKRPQAVLTWLRPWSRWRRADRPEADDGDQGLSRSSQGNVALSPCR